MEQRRTFRRFAAVISLICVIANSLAAQAPRKLPPPATDKLAAAKPGGWSGVITYKRSLNDSFTSDEKLFGRLDESERIKRNDTHTVSYTGSMVIRDPQGIGRPQTTTKVDYVENRSEKVVQTELTRCHSWESDRMIKAESTDRKITRGSGGGEGKSFNASVYNGKFRISFQMAEITGQYTHNTTSTYSNLCSDSTRKPSASNNESDTRIDGYGASVEGDADPKNPDVLSGTKTWVDGVYSGSKGVTHTVTWRLSRKPQPLIITDVRFYEPLYPSPSDWHEIGEKDRAVDGNQVKVVATVVNLSSTDKTTSVNFKELKENTALGDGPVSATIPANGQKDVELIWDTSGYAWKQSGPDVVPEMQRQVEVTIPDDKIEKDLKVIPKPALVIWGFWQSGSAIDDFHNYFKVFNPDWAVYSSRTDWAKVSTDNANALDRDVRQLQKSMNAWHVDLISSTNGGLVGRVYVNSKMPTQFDGRPTATHLVMVGVPNKGTPCATGLFGLSFRINTLSMDAVAELAPDAMKRFNLLVNNTNGTKFAALAVHSRYTCRDDIAGDGLTPVGSAIWRTKTNFVSHQNVWVREMMSDATHFRQIVKWIAIPPKGDHAPDPQTLAVNELTTPLPFDTAAGELLNTRHYGAMFAGRAAGDDGDQKADFAQVVRVQGGKTIDVPIPVKAGTRFSLQMLASEDVNATLIDDKGEVLGQNLGADSAREVFRSIALKKQFAVGTWKLRLENRGKKETELAVTAFVDYPLEEK